MAFVWDPKKAAKNILIRKLSFDVASFVFDDPHRMVRPDVYHSTYEDRYQTIGIVPGTNKMLFVAYSYEGDDDICIISAREAEPIERRIYHDRDGTIHTNGWERVNP